MKFMRHYHLHMKIGDTSIIEKFRNKVLTLEQISIQADDPYGYQYEGEDAGGAIYGTERLVLVFPKERDLSKVEVPFNYEFEYLKWQLHNDITIKLTTTNGDIVDTDDKEFDVVIVGTLESDELRPIGERGIKHASNR